MLRAAFRRAPDTLEAPLRLAQFLSRRGDHAGAARLFAHIAAARPSLAAAHSDLGSALLHLGKAADAVAALRRAVAIAPEHPVYLVNLAAALQEAGELDAAAETCRRAIERAPDLHHAYLNMGVILEQLGRKPEAAIHFRRAFDLAPRDPRVLTNLGNVELARGDAVRAAALQREALSIAPDFAEAEANLGTALLAMDQFEVAEQALRRAVKLKPGLTDAHKNLGIALEQQSRYAEALHAFDRAIERAPDNAEAHVARAMALLRQGDFDTGWAAYEWRWRTRGAMAVERRFDRPAWRGEPIEDRTILLHAEQGIGDSLQFLRYVPMVTARGARVILEVQAPLRRLCADLPDVDLVVAAGDALPPHELHCPLLSLPGVFATAVDTIPAATPYIRADAALAATWRRRLDRPGLKVGLAWAGNPDFRDDRRRSITADLLAPLLAVPGIAFHALQVGSHAHDLPSEVEALGPEFRDFADTAACMMALDMIVSVDTAVAHLAGALGRRVLVMLPKVPDWRWLVDRSDSPWYPSAKLFRQQQAGEWRGVVERVAHELAANARGERTISC